MSNMPKPLVAKLLYTLFLGIGFLAVGTAYYFGFSQDRIFLYMSIFVFAASLFKGGLLLYKVKTNRFETVEGICIGFVSKPFSKFRGVKFIDDEGIEATVRLPKNHKFSIERKYRLYFSKQTSPLVGSEFIDTHLATDSFLGYEEIEGENIPKENC